MEKTVTYKEGERPQHLDLGLPICRTVRRYISADSALRSVALCHGSLSWFIHWGKSSRQDTTEAAAVVSQMRTDCDSGWGSAWGWWADGPWRCSEACSWAGPGPITWLSLKGLEKGGVWWWFGHIWKTSLPAPVPPWLAEWAPLSLKQTSSNLKLPLLSSPGQSGIFQSLVIPRIWPSSYQKGSDCFSSF